MAEIKVSMDLSGLLSTYSGLVSQLYPLLSQAVEGTAAQGAQSWKDAIHKAKLWSGEKQPYLESIKYQMTGAYEAEIWSDYEQAGAIEDGRAARDLKKSLQTSHKTRKALYGPNAGKRYLIVPMRHNVPTSSGEGAHAQQMPAAIYKKAKKLQLSRMLAPGSVNAPTRISASGHEVVQHSYQWGGRLPPNLEQKANPMHKTDKYAGMVRMQTSVGKKKSSAYLTFRIMGEWSNGWIVPAAPGLKLAEQVAVDLEQVLQTNVGEAITLGMLRK